MLNFTRPVSGPFALIIASIAAAVFDNAFACCIAAAGALGWALHLADLGGLGEMCERALCVAERNGASDARRSAASKVRYISTAAINRVADRLTREQMS